MGVLGPGAGLARENQSRGKTGGWRPVRATCAWPPPHLTCFCVLLRSGLKRGPDSGAPPCQALPLGAGSLVPKSWESPPPAPKNQIIKELRGLAPTGLRSWWTDQGHPAWPWRFSVAFPRLSLPCALFCIVHSVPSASQPGPPQGGGGVGGRSGGRAPAEPGKLPA